MSTLCASTEQLVICTHLTLIIITGTLSSQYLKLKSVQVTGNVKGWIYQSKHS